MHVSTSAAGIALLPTPTNGARLGWRRCGVAPIVPESAASATVARPGAPGRAFVIERGLEQDGNAAMHKLIADYVDQAVGYDEIPILTSALDRYVQDRGRRDSGRERAFP